MSELREKAMSTTGDVRFSKTNIVKIKVFRRNILDETASDTPIEFIFDMSKFIIEGYDSILGPADASESYSAGQTLEDLYSKSVIRTYSESGLDYTSVGSAYQSPLHGTEQPYEQIFINTVNDFYCKLYMSLSTGIDVSEDIFLFLEDNALFTDPDPELESDYNEMIQAASLMFIENNPTAALSYDRLIGELRRSIMISPDKWRNRIVYPKVFDRVFCILLDESDFDSPSDVQERIDQNILEVDNGTGGMDTVQFFEDLKAGVNSIRLLSETNIPTMYQYFVELSVGLPPQQDE